MRVLVTESNPQSSAAVESELRAAGHDVVRCRAEGASAFPCAGLAGDACPVDHGVDVALTVRSHPRSTPTPTEDGVICALRGRVPVVVAGQTLFQPFSGFDVTEVQDGDVVAAVEQAAASRRSAHEAVALPLVAAVLEQAGVAGTPEVAVVRSRDGLNAELRVPAATPDAVRAKASVRVAAGLRAYDRGAARINVSVAVLPGPAAVTTD